MAIYMTKKEKPTGSPAYGLIGKAHVEQGFILGRSRLGQKATTANPSQEEEIRPLQWGAFPKTASGPVTKGDRPFAQEGRTSHVNLNSPSSWTSQGCLYIPLLHTPWTNAPKRPVEVQTPLPKRVYSPYKVGWGFHGSQGTGMNKSYVLPPIRERFSC